MKELDLIPHQHCLGAIQMPDLFSACDRKVVEQNLDIDKRNEDHYGATIHHLSLLRNKRCLMAYMYII
jgi:hypothetical protein